MYNIVVRARALYACSLVALRASHWKTLERERSGVIRHPFGKPRTSPMGMTYSETMRTTTYAETNQFPNSLRPKASSTTAQLAALNLAANQIAEILLPLTMVFSDFRVALLTLAKNRKFMVVVRSGCAVSFQAKKREKQCFMPVAQVHAAAQASDKVATRNAATRCSGIVAFKVTKASIGIQTARTMKETECQTDIGLSDVVAHLEQQRYSTPVATVIPVTPATPVHSEPSMSYRDDSNDDTCEPLFNCSEAEVASSSHMELVLLKRANSSLDVHGVEVTQLVTDRHPQVKKYLRTKKPGIEHLFDACRVGKGVKKSC
ncbi:hypothetical protein MRX96_048251 [Rhipicephalus microplus]